MEGLFAFRRNFDTMKPLFALLFFLFLFTGMGNAQNLFINEIIAENETGQMDGFFERDDWIEIYNTGGITNLAGYYLSDDPSIPNKWQIPGTNAGTTTVLPNDHIIFWCDRDPEQGENHADFGLNIDGESLLLVAPDGVTIIDQVDFPQLAPDISWGRTCDGCPEFQYFNNVTYNAANTEIVPVTSFVMINEVMVHNTSYWKDLQNEYEPWIEIFNPNSTYVNIAGASIELSTGETWTIPADNPYRTVIAPGDFGYFWMDGEFTDGSNHSTYALQNTAFTISIRGNNGTLLDSFAYSPTGENQSQGRTTDGSASISVFNSPTPGVTNALIIIPAPELYINELLSVNVADVADEEGQYEDWFEIYNPTSSSINLAGYYISDNPENPRKWQVPFFDAPATTVEAGGWILFWADEDQSQGILHTSFRLNNSEESIRLTTPDGITLVDEISWQGMDADTSYGRVNDGSPIWVLFTGTTPDASNNGGTVEVREMTEINSIAAFPNPTRDIVRFTASHSYSVFSADGRYITRKINSAELDMSAYDASLYLIRSDDGTIFRIIKH